jgi:hypothetical protein
MSYGVAWGLFDKDGIGDEVGTLKYEQTLLCCIFLKYRSVLCSPEILGGEARIGADFERQLLIVSSYPLKCYLSHTLAIDSCTPCFRCPIGSASLAQPITQVYDEWHLRGLSSHYKSSAQCSKRDPKREKCGSEVCLRSLKNFIRC